MRESKQLGKAKLAFEIDDLFNALMNNTSPHISSELASERLKEIPQKCRAANMEREDRIVQQ
ncbi:MAG: hypothetical protein ACRD3W_12065, partial [Terriglobales bacterium]